MKFRLAISMLVCVLVMPRLASAAVKVWDGGGADANWMTKENWVGDVAPVVNVDSLEFPEGAAQKSSVNNFPFVSYFFGIHFSGATGGYVLSGQLLLLGGPVTSSNTSGTNTINFAISTSSNGLAALTAVNPGGTLTMTGLVNLLFGPSGLALTLDGAGNINIAGNLSYTGRVQKLGAGTVTMTYANTYSGTTIVVAGTLIVNGSQSSSPISMVGGTLGGSGTVGTIVVSQGTVSPGASPGILNAFSTTLSGSDVSFNAELNGPAAGTGFDQLNVTGAVNLGGATLNATLGFVPATGAEFTLINNDGSDAVIGTFAGLPQGASFTISNRFFSISYVGGTGNDVVVTATAAAQKLVNRSFDDDLSGWSVFSVPSVTTQWDPSDADQWPTSGSADSQNGHPSINYVALRQCVVVARPGANYSYGGRVFIPLGQPATAKAAIGVTWMSDETCTSSIAGGSAYVVISGSWQSLQQSVTAPAEAKSALVYLVVGWESSARFDNIFFGPVKPTDPPLVDLNGDGNGDAFLYNAVTGDWQRQVTQADDSFATTSGSWSPGWTVVPASFDVGALTDFFLFNTTSGQWAKMLNNGVGFITQASGGWWPGWERYVLDLNGDRISDFFLYDPATGMWFKCFSTPTGFTYSQGGWNPGWEIYPMRLNDDALGDMFLINRTTGRWFWVLGAVGEGFTYPVTETWFPGWQLYPGDFNGDGLSDLLLHDPPTGTYFVATANASGFTYQQGGWSLGWTPYVADLDADGKDDLFLHDAATGVWFQMIGDGAGNFTNVGGQTWSLGWNLYPSDFDGDGRMDLLLYDPATGAWYQARNLVSGAFTYSTGTWAPGLTVVTR